MPTDELPTFDNPRGWTWRNDLDVPSQLHVEPAFLDHLGEVFIRIDQQGRHLGIWLTREVMEEFIAAMRNAARRQHDPSLLMEEPDLYPKTHGPKDERRADDAHMAAGEAWMEHDAEQGEGGDRG